MSRPLTRYVRNLHHAHKYAWWFVRAFALFREPTQFLGHYFRSTSPASRRVEFRDGTVFHLSGHPHDIITLFVIFVRRDYGFIAPDTTVVDIGANTGVFSLYAAKSGARRILAFEPNGESVACLTQNANSNGLENRIVPRQLAVGDTPDQEVRFPVHASVHNRVAREGDQGEFEVVRTTTLHDILAREAPEGIDLLKMDCEGAEYGIFASISADDLRRIREIRMEYHEGRVDELEQKLRGAGFEIVLRQAHTARIGNLWARRTN